MFLVDTSAWIAHFSSKDPFDLRQVSPPEERVLCLPVYRKILQGIREETSFRSIQEILDAALFVENPMDRAGSYRAAPRAHDLIFDRLPDRGHRPSSQPRRCAPGS